MLRPYFRVPVGKATPQTAREGYFKRPDSASNAPKSQRIIASTGSHGSDGLDDRKLQVRISLAADARLSLHH
jgi:hypothetical protein